MTEEEIRQVRQMIWDELSGFIRRDRYVFQKLIQFNDGVNIQLAKTTGTKIGTETTQKIGFYGSTPVDKPETVSDPSGGGTQDAEARTAISSLIDRLQELGLIK